LFFAAWLIVLGGIATLVIAANGKTGSRTCKGVRISINADGDKLYVKEGDVLKTIEKITNGSVVKKQFAGINLGALERSLEANPWVRDAELYFDTRDVLHVSVWERHPVARVFTTGGRSFYMDSSGYQLPLLENYSAKLPVVTGFADAKKLSAKDSVLLQGVKNIVTAVSRDSFWNVQVGQIDITPERKFELIPLIGSHIIRLGYGENAEEKLANLFVFYKQVLPKAGLAKYSALDVQFEGQVVAVRKGPASIVDSVQLQKNIEELLKKKAAEQEPDDVALAAPVKTFVPSTINVDSVVIESAVQPRTVAQRAVNPPTPERTNNKKPNPDKAAVRKPNPQKPKQPTKTDALKPKALMPVKAQNEY
jgi:cell division protein FtsQ